MKTKRSHLVATDSIRATRLRGDRLMTAVCCALWFVTLALASLHGTWLAWSLLASFLVVVAALLTLLIPGTRGSRIGIGCCLTGFPFLAIYQTNGLIESHFGYFIVLTLLLYYRDWRPIFVATPLVAVQQLFFCWFQMHGSPVLFFQTGHVVEQVATHFAYLTAMSSALVFLTLTIRLEALESSAIAAFGERISKTGTLDLTFDSDRHQGAAARGLTSLLSALQAITNHSAELATRIDQVSDSISHCSTRMLEVVTTTKGDILPQVLQSAEGMSEAGGRIRAECVAVADVAADSANIVNDGCATMQLTATLIQTVSETADSTVHEINHLQSESARIESIVRIMNDLSNQSSLLALNASIEAARAGEKGKGFQVVAQEIRTLSERSYQSLAEVQSIVDTIGQRVGQLHLHAHRCQAAVSEGGAQVQAAHAALTEVAQHLPMVAQRAVRVVETADHQAALAAEVLSGMARIRQAMVTNAAEMQNVAQLSQSLEQVSDELSANVQQFRTSPQAA